MTLGMRTDSAFVRLQDYRPPEYRAPTIDLSFDLDPAATRVRAATRFTRVGAEPVPLRLACGSQPILGIAIDGVPLAPSAWSRGEGEVRIHAPPADFLLEVETELAPEANTALEGLYMSGGRFCTQCEAEGFRTITPALDRPDSLSRYTVRLSAARERFPTLLSNGDLLDSGAVDVDRHFAVWRDPHPKPSYLFALVAGAFEHLEETFVTASGRAVRLGLYVDPGDGARAHYAMDALQRAMRWDEVAFGREYDLERFNLVAVRDFNFGAMENKGLNIFNSAYVLADADTATDADFEAIESVVAHEYFHNWTGNRITLRDWFQLCLKEGLTVYRDQEFSADSRSRGVQRIKDVRRLRARQFIEDAGPLAHPVRPTSYVKIDNFYTATVYEKGAELVRMLHTLIGPERFAAGMARYFADCDGTAATVEDFIRAFEEAGAGDLASFKTWYAQVGTPKLQVRRRHAEDSLELRFKVLGADGPVPPIPLRIGVLDAAGQEAVSERLVTLIQPAQVVRIAGVQGTCVPSLLRGFSAPVEIDDDLSDSERLLLLAHDPDPFTRWEAAQRLARGMMLRALHADVEAAAQDLAHALEQELDRDDPALAALMLRLPDLPDVFQHAETPDPEALDTARRAVKRAVASALRSRLEAVVARPEPTPPSPDPAQAGVRALRTAALDLLAALPDQSELLFKTFCEAKTMTIAVGALEALAAADGPQFDHALERFEARWRRNPLVMDKWFAVQAGALRSDARLRLEGLRRHTAFDLANPNRVRSLAMPFAQRNLTAFHSSDGWGYAFLAEIARAVDERNATLGARLLSPFETWRRMDRVRQERAGAALRALQSDAKLSKNAREVIDRMLNGS